MAAGPRSTNRRSWRDRASPAVVLLAAAVPQPDRTRSRTGTGVPLAPPSRPRATSSDPARATRSSVIDGTRGAVEDLARPSTATDSWPIVRQAWMVNGDSDFLLHCVAENLTRFQDFVIEVLTANEHVDTVRTMLTIRQVKKVGLVEI